MTLVRLRRRSPASGSNASRMIWRARKFSKNIRIQLSPETFITARGLTAGSRAREILTKAMSLFSPAVLIHDAQYTESNGSREGFEETVRFWVVNTRKIFDAEFPLWTLKMLKRAYRVERAYWWGVMKASNAAIATETAFEAYQAAATQ